MSSETLYYTRPGSFIDRFMAYMVEQETPTIYDFYTALWMLSAVVGRNVIVDRPRAPVHLNMYIILTSESGVTRKSTAIRAGMSILRPVLSQIEPPYALIEAKTTPEHMMHVLTQQTKAVGSAKALIAVSELAAALGRSTGNTAMPALLTDLYDCPDVRDGGGTLSHGTYGIKDVYLSFLSASTPTWLVKAVNPDIIEGGFTSRCYFISAERRKKRIAWPSVDSDANSSATIRQILHQTAERSAKYNRIRVTDHAKQLFVEWYDKRTQATDSYRASFESREDAHVLRIAGLLCINDGSFEIQYKHVEKAITLVADIKRMGSLLFTPRKEEPIANRLIDRIINVLLKVGDTGISQGKMLLACNYIAKSNLMTATLLVMHELGFVERFTVQAKTKPVTVWRATKALQHDGARALILDNMDAIDV